MESWIKWALGAGAAAGAVAVGASIAKKGGGQIKPAPTPIPPGQAPYVPPVFTPPAAPPTTIHQTIDPVTNLPTIVLQPGDMGNVSLLSAQSFGNPSAAPVLYLTAPAGGAILSVVSSDPNNVANNVAASQADATPAISLGGAAYPGVVTLTVSWFDKNQAPQTSSFTITAS